MSGALMIGILNSYDSYNLFPLLPALIKILYSKYSEISFPNIATFPPGGTHIPATFSLDECQKFIM